MKTRRLTMSQALILYLKNQWVERDGVERPFFGGVFGILGHGNVAGVGQALQENPEFRFVPVRNEQAGVHMAVGWARMKNRLGAWACTSSVGPGATNMVTGAALATINRLPVLLLPGDVFARRNVAPVLQQLESGSSQDCSVNDCFRPVSRYWDRINRPDQLSWALPEVMRVLTSPADSGAATLALPEDVQAEAFDYPAGLFEQRVWPVPRQRPDFGALARASSAIRESRRPLIVAGGGVVYSEATEALARLAAATGIPVAETQAGKGSLVFDHPCNLGGLGVTGTIAANATAAEADLVIGIGTRYSDFTTASKTAFQDPEVRFVNVNVAEFDAFKNGALAVVGDARCALDEISSALEGFRVDETYSEKVSSRRAAWDAEVDALCAVGGGGLPSQAQVISVLNRELGPRGVIVNAAGSAPGDLHKLWRATDPKGYHVEYGYSCMGYEVPGAIGVKMAAPDREVVALVGDGGWLMMNGDLTTSIQEGVRITVVIVENHGFASIGGLSRSLGSGGFGCEFRMRGVDGALSGRHLPLDLAANAGSLGVRALRARTLGEFGEAFAEARREASTCVVVVETDPGKGVPGSSWWDVPPAEVSGMEEVRKARAAWVVAVGRER